MEATPVLPSDEVERLASLSAGLSSGGVLRTRSDLPDSTPENILIIAFNTSISSVSAAMS